MDSKEFVEGFSVEFKPRHGAASVFVNPLAVAYVEPRPPGIDPQTQAQIERTRIVFGAGANGLHEKQVDHPIDEVRRMLWGGLPMRRGEDPAPEPKALEPAPEPKALEPAPEPQTARRRTAKDAAEGAPEKPAELTAEEAAESLQQHCEGE